ncbi:MAG: hypothetical protein CML99_15600 [Rhodobiaceae bacterium]|nr:hypothetical protein [Rhodobiaceae bacterium]|tara:strand:- start:496 stop:1131 length:636 start_codon:yes stop_codon:yes gene_type:complete
MLERYMKMTPLTRLARPLSAFFIATMTLAASLPGAHAEDGARQEAPATTSESTYSEAEVIEATSKFFGVTAETMAEVVHRIFSDNGGPNAYIKGEEGGGAVVVGLRYGDGTIVMKSGETKPVFWQGPSAGWDFGGDGTKVFTLVYNLPDTNKIYQRFPGVSGSAFFIGGISVNYQQRGNIILVPMRAGVGFRLGANIGYLKYTKEREWIPF